MTADIPLIFEEIKISSTIIAYAFNIEEIDRNLGKYIDKKLISICKGKREIKLETVKKQFIKYLESKNQSNLLTGAVSEFFIHLLLSSQEFKQEFLYFNLEENSIKKGFDGYYTKGAIDWILESKSTTNPIAKHKKGIQIAYNGVKNKIEGVDNVNNPWENAYNHANNRNVNSKKTLVNKLNALSQLYTNENYGKIENFNIMASSTIFLEKYWQNVDVNELKKDIDTYLKDKKFKNIIVICLNKKSTQHLIDYLKL